MRSMAACAMWMPVCRGVIVSRAVGHEFGVLREMLGRDDVSADDVAKGVCGVQGLL